jgi:cysteine desulfurase / selenocysteine lyase
MTDLVYLDNASTTFPKPDCVYDIMASFYKENGVSPGRSGSDLAIAAGMMMDDTRKLLHKLFNNPDPDHRKLIFSSSATEALNLAIRGIAEKGDHFITTEVEHNSVLRPLYMLKQEGLIDYDIVPMDPKSGKIDPTDIENAIRPETKMVIVNHGSNVLGTIQPTKEIGNICKEHNILYLLDASQTAGVIPVDMQEFNADIVVFAGHKSLFGPCGTGGMAIGPDVPIRSSKWGGTGIKSALRCHPDDFPQRLETGTPNILGISGLNAGVKWILEQGIENIHNQEMKLVSQLVDGLKNLDGVTLHCAGSDLNHLPVLSITIDNITPQELTTRLDVDYNVTCRAGLQCAPYLHDRIGTSPNGTLRIGVGPFNTTEHIEIVVKALSNIIKESQQRAAGAGSA